MSDIEATFEKYIWPKSINLTRAQNDIMDKIYSNIRREIQSIQVVPPRPNFSQRLRMALKSLREDPNIIIAKADKGDSVVVMDSEQYYGLAAKHLADSRTYELLKNDPSGDIALRYHRYLDRCSDDKILDDYEHRRLRIPSDYQLPTIYFLPKIHKHPLKLRPIVASVKSITTNASRFMDKNFTTVHEAGTFLL